MLTRPVFIFLLALARNASGFSINSHATVTSFRKSLNALSSSNDDDRYGRDDYEEEHVPSLSRRAALSKSAQSLAATILLSSTAAVTVPPAQPALASDVPQYATQPKTIFITGCNSGIGYDAVKRMAKRGHKIVLACRSYDKANDAVARIRTELGAEGYENVKLVPKECDLTDLGSVRSCVRGLADVGVTNVDALCLNAGIARNTAATDVLRTSQGFEATIGTNHLGHFYLTNEILPLMSMNSNIIVTASSVHDPDSPGGAQGSKATLGNLEGLEAAVSNKDGMFDMVDGKAFDADKAYKDSKLCNIFFMRELQNRLDRNDVTKEKKVKVNAFTPGLIVSTGLFRDQNPIFTKVFDFVATDVFKVGEPISFGGGALEYMTLSNDVTSKSGLYYFSPPGSSKYGDAAYGNQFAPTEVSIEARDDAKGKRLWELSEQLVGIKTIV